MSIYIDTSAFMALANADDSRHRDAVRAWQEMLASDETLVTCSYVVCETISLMHSREGTATVDRFAADILAAVDIEWVDPAWHQSALTALLVIPGKSGPSLTDCAGLDLIRRLRITSVFAYDRHFAGQGFRLVG